MEEVYSTGFYYYRPGSADEVLCFGESERNDPLVLNPLLGGKIYLVNRFRLNRGVRLAPDEDVEEAISCKRKTLRRLEQRFRKYSQKARGIRNSRKS